ncbi:MAG: hypothetical protein ACXVCY_14570 [Pseudobdellovibrionaceae bacterium]
MKFMLKSQPAKLLMAIPLVFSAINASASASVNERYKISVCKFNSTLSTGGSNVTPSDASATSDSAEFAKNAYANFYKSLANLKYPEQVTDANQGAYPSFNAAAIQGIKLWDFLKVYLQKLDNQYTGGSISTVMGPEELCSYLNHNKFKQDQLEQDRLFTKGDPTASQQGIDFLLNIPTQSNQPATQSLSLATPESSKAAVNEIMKTSDLVSAVVKATVDKEFVILNGDIAIRLPLNMSLDLGAQSQSVINGKGLLNRLFVSSKHNSVNTNRYVLLKLVGFKVPRVPPSQWTPTFFDAWNNQKPSLEIFFGDQIRYVQMGQMARLQMQSFETRVAQKSALGPAAVVSDKLTIRDKKFWTTPLPETWEASGADHSRLDGVINLGGQWTNLGQSIENVANKMLPLILNIDHLIIKFVPQQITTTQLKQLGDRNANVKILVPDIVNPSLQTQGLTGLYFQLPNYLSVGAADFIISLFGTPYHVFKADENSPLHIPIPKDATLPAIEANNKKIKAQTANGIDLLYSIIDKNITSSIDTNLDCSNRTTDDEWEKCLDIQAKKVGFDPNL